MKYKYFVGVEHQKIHYKFLHDLLGGEFVTYPCTIFTETFSPELLKEDNEDVIWFFSDIFYHLHPFLKGKQVLTKHGMTFGPYLDQGKANCINNYFDMVFQPGLTQENKYKQFKINPEKIKDVGFTLLFEIPELPIRKNSILFASTCFRHWNHYGNLYKILEQLEPEVDAYVSFHPYTPPNALTPFIELIRKKKGMKLLTTQEEFLEACAYCERTVCGGSGSVAAPFWFKEKPVILLRGESQVNEHAQKIDPKIGWERVKKEMDETLFSKILDESEKISNWKNWDLKKVLAAKPAPTAKMIFYPSNWNKKDTEKKIKKLLKELSVK